MKRTAKEYQEVLMDVFRFKIATAEMERDSDDRWSESYISGLREALRTIKDSSFLIGEGE